MKFRPFGIKILPPGSKFMLFAVCFFSGMFFVFFVLEHRLCTEGRKSCTCKVHDLRSYYTWCKKHASGMFFMLLGMFFMLFVCLQVWISCSLQFCQVWFLCSWSEPFFSKKCIFLNLFFSFLLFYTNEGKKTIQLHDFWSREA